MNGIRGGSKRWSDLCEPRKFEEEMGSGEGGGGLSSSSFREGERGGFKSLKPHPRRMWASQVERRQKGRRRHEGRDRKRNDHSPFPLLSHTPEYLLESALGSSSERSDFLPPSPSSLSAHRHVLALYVFLFFSFLLPSLLPFLTSFLEALVLVAL